MPLSPSRVRASCCSSFCLIQKSLIAAEASEHTSSTVPEHHVALTSREQNVVRYMAGYDVRKLKKKFKKRCVRPEQQKKNDLFLFILLGMESKDQGDSNLSTCNWVEMIDREGLCHVSDDTYKLMELIEVVTRRYLRSDGVHQPPGQAIQQQIVSNVVDNKLILSLWDTLPSPIPSQYEAFSFELLKEAVVLWTTVRCFSYAKSLNDKTS